MTRVDLLGVGVVVGDGVPDDAGDGAGLGGALGDTACGVWGVLLPWWAPSLSLCPARDQEGRLHVPLDHVHGEQLVAAGLVLVEK